jgi:hypothetical protein
MNMLTGTVMTDGCVHLLHNSSWKFYQLAAGQLLPGQTVYGAAGQAAWTVHHVQNHTLLGHSLPASQAGRRVWPAL